MIKGIEIVDLSIYFKNKNILIISDTHVGYEEALNKDGILIPRFHFKELIQRLDKIFSRLRNKKLDKIIINGDVKHEFGNISEQEWRNTLLLLDHIKKHCNEIILIKGNHDKILGPIAEKRNIKIVNNLMIGDILITHGDVIIKPDKNIKTIIIGHEHPAISLKDNSRVETFKCFLKGKYKDKTLIVQPSFNLVTEGSDILKDKALSPYLHHDLSQFEAYIVSDKVYRFGKLKNLT